MPAFLEPDDPLQKALLAITKCQPLLRSTQAHLASPARETRFMAEETMRGFTELGRMIAAGKGGEIDTKEICISTLGAHLDEIQTIADNSRDRSGRRKLAQKVLNAMDVLGMQISKAGRSPNRVA